MAPKNNSALKIGLVFFQRVKPTAPAREANLERNPNWRLVVLAGGKDRDSHELGQFRGVLSFYERVLLCNAFVKEFFC